MQTEWIYDVMLLNAKVIEAENQFGNQVSRILAMVEKGEDTSLQEDLLVIYENITIKLRISRDRYF